MVAEWFRECVKFKSTLTQRPWFKSPLGIMILIAQSQNSSNQSRLTTQIKCRRHVTVPAVPTQEAIPEEGKPKACLSLFSVMFMDKGQYFYLETSYTQYCSENKEAGTLELKL